jgi:hypothetical protein
MGILGTGGMCFFGNRSSQNANFKNSWFDCPIGDRPGVYSVLIT